MGYTHYFAHKKTTKKKWAKILADCKKVCLNNDVAITGWNGELGTLPVFNEEEIRFNGIEPEACETFAIEQEGRKPASWEKDKEYGFAFCKTRQFPYDLLVCACLLIYKYHSPETMDLGSDGDFEDWAEAEQLVKETLGYDITYKKICKYED